MLNRLENKIRHLQVFSTKTAQDLLAGEYHSVFKGHGLEFSELREYQYGDDPRSINWQITAKTGHPFVKRYIEERDLTLFFIVDLSASGNFGSRTRSKKDTIAELCALLAFSAIKNSDKVGLIIFSDQVEHIVPPGRGKKHVLRIINELLCFNPKSQGTNINLALDYFGHLHAKRSVTFLISDFQDKNFEESMALISRQHDLIAVSVNDHAEIDLPDSGLLTISDPESGQTITIDTSSPKVRSEFKRLALLRQAELSELFSRHNIDRIQLSGASDIVAELICFFKIRKKRGRHG
jgi:uncharacterized protein (DUF58 family)